MNAQQRSSDPRDEVPGLFKSGAASPEKDSSGGSGVPDSRGELSRIIAIAESPGAFHSELSETMNEFVDVVRQSRTRIAELSWQLAERDDTILMLDAKVALLEARLGISHAVPAAVTRPANSNAGIAPAPTGVAGDPAKNFGIWRRLTRLEHH